MRAALKVMTPIFKMGPGTPIGSGGGLGPAHGQQWMSWIHIDDIVGIFKLAVENAGAVGPLNGAAPNPVRNAEFARTFSAVLRKPLTPWRFYLPVGPPDMLLRMVLGEVATVVATGQRVLPTRPLSLGYSFRYPELGGAARDLQQETPRVRGAAGAFARQGRGASLTSVGRNPPSAGLIGSPTPATPRHRRSARPPR